MVTVENYEKLRAENKQLRRLLIESLSIVHCPFCTVGTPCGECEACMEAQAHGERVLAATKKGGE